MIRRPEHKMVPVLDFFEVVDYLVEKHDLDKSRDGHKQTLWKLINEQVMNDTSKVCWFKERYEETPPDENGEWWSYHEVGDPNRKNYTKGFQLMKLIIDEYDKDCNVNDVLWEICW